MDPGEPSPSCARPSGEITPVPRGCACNLPGRVDIAPEQVDIQLVDSEERDLELSSCHNDGPNPWRLGPMARTRPRTHLALGGRWELLEIGYVVGGYRRRWSSPLSAHMSCQTLTRSSGSREGESLFLARS